MRKSVLQEILAPLDADEFLRDAWARSAVHVVGPKDKFAALFDGVALDRYLNHRLRFFAPPAIQLYSGREGGGRVPPDLYQETIVDANRGTMTVVSPGRVQALCRQGATLMIHSAHDGDPALKRFAAALAAELGELLRIDLFYSPPRSSGVHAHYDREDVLVLQVEGEKEWRLNAPTVAAPLEMPDYDELARAPRRPEQIVRLRRGDLLHVPRGYWHSTATTGEPSIHLSVRVACRLGSDLLEWALRALRAESPRLRENLPLRRQSAPPFGYDPATLRATADVLVREFTEFLARPASLARFDRECVASDRDPAPYRLDPCVAREPGPDTPLAWAGPRLRYVLEDRDDGGATLTARGRALGFTAPEAAVLRDALARDRFTIALLSAVAASATVDATLHALLEAGLVTLVREEDR